MHACPNLLTRYGFKLMLDQTLLGDISDEDELEECLQAYENEWYIGRESDAEWGQAVVKNRPNLFSLGHNYAQVSMVIGFVLFFLNLVFHKR